MNLVFRLSAPARVASVSPRWEISQAAGVRRVVTELSQRGREPTRRVWVQGGSQPAGGRSEGGA
jgi:hypothetical protein